MEEQEEEMVDRREAVITEVAVGHPEVTTVARRGEVCQRAVACQGAYH